MYREQALILEITRETDVLKMSISARGELSDTLKHYSQHKVNFSDVNYLCDELVTILNKLSHNELSAVKSLEKTGHTLWDSLLTHPVKEKLKQKYGSGLLLDIDEELVSIPWELLHDGNNFLALDFSIGRLIKTKSQPLSLSYRSRGHFLKMLILADPTQDLKSAYSEGLSIRNQFDLRRRDIRIDFKSANISKLYINKNICDYDIVHFAGHCEYDQRNMKKSGWVLSDGVFTIQDVLRLSGSSLPQLIFSNACNSAQPLEGSFIDKDYQRKNYSLASAFLFSGVSHYIGSLRRIEDNASLVFAKEFYHNLIMGNTVGSSLRFSRLRLIRDYGLSAMHWANYLLYGDPNFVLFRPREVRAKKKKVFPRNLLKRLLLSVLSLFFLGGLLVFLPTVNPGTYVSFLKSRRYFEQGNSVKVIETGKRVIEKEKGFLGIYPLVADSYHKLGDKANALKYYYDYMLISQGKGDLKNLLSAYIAIGWIYQLDGDNDKARSFYDKALNLSREIKDKLNEAISLRKLAVWNIDKGDYDLALELLIKSSEINRQRQHLSAHRYNLACDYFDIGLVFSNKNDFTAAKEFYRKSLKLFEKTRLKNELSDYYFNMGELYLYEKQYKKALDYYLLGLKIDLAQGNKMNLASDYNMIGELYLEMDNLADAQGNLHKALEVSQYIGSRPEIAESAYNLGILYKKMGRISKSKEFLRKAQEIYEQIDPVSYREVKEEILGLN